MRPCFGLKRDHIIKPMLYASLYTPVWLVCRYGAEFENCSV